MNKTTVTTGLIAALALFNAEAEPGGTYTLTGSEKSVAEMIKADMAQYPELYQGESFNSYMSKFKEENRIGKRKLSPGDVLIFPDTNASIKLTTSEPKEAAKEPELVVEATGSITVTAAWLAYGGARKLWRTEKFSETYPEADGYIAVTPDFRTTGLSGICVPKMVRKDGCRWEENEEHLRTSLRPRLPLRPSRA